MLGTSGWSYPAWRGLFYPAKLPGDQMLAFYAQHFRAVEINNTFYRMPARTTLEKWRATVPASFRFTFKAPGAITHRRRLKEAEQATRHFAELTTSVMGDCLGPVLFQLPPNQQADEALLRGFLDLARPLFPQVAFEFRHASWLEPALLDVLRDYNVSLCSTESDAERQPLHPTPDFAYLRLRKTAYSDAELETWRSELLGLAASGPNVFCFLKHDVDKVVYADNVLTRFARLTQG